MHERTRARFAIAWVVVIAPACTLANPAFNGVETDARVDSTDADAGSGDADGKTLGDGDGDTSSTVPGDGDGDGETGDGETGDMCAPLVDCDGECVDLATKLNCGECGNLCLAETMCYEGECVDPKQVARVVFVSSQWYSGALGGLDGAATACTKLATDASLTGDFKPWLGVGTSGPADTFTKHGHFVLVDGTMIAESWLDLIDTTLLDAIALDEFGNQGTGPAGCNGQSAVVWTGVTPQGITLAANCSGWTVEEGQAAVGYMKGVGPDWTMAGCEVHCAELLPIYCFEQ